MTETDLFKLLDNIVSLSLLLLVWQLERKRSERLEAKVDRFTEVFIDEHKARLSNKNDGSSL
jgi:hypothetical protein